MQECLGDGGYLGDVRTITRLKKKPVRKKEVLFRSEF
jgi:hypothetical protein